MILGLPDQVSLHDALQVAGATGRLQSMDFTFDLNQTYTFWSGMIGGLFLMLGYFGCDQSQVQRYLTARSLKDARKSLLVSAFAKIPLQALILLTGVLVFVFYVFHEPPMLFNPVHEARVGASGRAAEYAGLEQEFHRAFDARRVAADAVVTAHDSGNEAQLRLAESGFNARNDDIQAVRARAETLVKQVAGDERYTDVNYVFPSFVLDELPIGLVGLIIAAIFAAAMSSISAELNSLSTATVIDFYRRYVRRSSSDAHYLLVSKIVTGVWGAFAIVVALYAVNLGSLIEVVNRFGSFFYGSLLGVFVLAVGRALGERQRRLLGNDRRHGCSHRRRRDDVDLVPVAQRGGCSRGLPYRHGRERGRPAGLSSRTPPRSGCNLQDFVDEEQIGEQRAQVDRGVEIVHELRAKRWLGEHEPDRRPSVTRVAIEHFNEGAVVTQGLELFLLSQAAEQITDPGERVIDACEEVTCLASSLTAGSGWQALRGERQQKFVAFLDTIAPSFQLVPQRHQVAARSRSAAGLAPPDSGPTGHRWGSWCSR